MGIKNEIAYFFLHPKCLYKSGFQYSVIKDQLCFIGGKNDNKSNPYEEILREIKEETNIDMEKEYQFKSNPIPLISNNYYAHYFQV